MYKKLYPYEENDNHLKDVLLIVYAYGFSQCFWNYYIVHNNIENFLKFMNLKYNVQWINIFYRTGEQANKLAYTYGSKKGLEKAHY